MLYGKIPIKEKSATSVGIRVGRPEKAMMRKQKPAVECIFPINKDGGLKSDILEAIKPKPGDDPITKGSISEGDILSWLYVSIELSFIPSQRNPNKD